LDNCNNDLACNGYAVKVVAAYPLQASGIPRMHVDHWMICDKSEAINIGLVFPERQNCDSLAVYAHVQ